MKGFILLLFAWVAGVSFGEVISGSFIATHLNTIEHVFLENGTVSLSLYVLPESSKLGIWMCTEKEQNKILNSGGSISCDNSNSNNKVSCEYMSSVLSGKSWLVQHNISRYGKYYINLIPCASSEIVVNWTASLINSGSHLSAALIPATGVFQTTGLLWCVMAVAYLVTLRRHWKKAQRIQKYIAVYPIMKIGFAYYATIFYAYYSSYGAFTTNRWAWYWAFTVGLQLILGISLLLLSKTGSNGVRVNCLDVVSIFFITFGQAVLYALQCTIVVSQLLQLLMWILQTLMYVMMVAYILTWMTRRLQKTANVLRYSIRHTIEAPHRRQSNLRVSTQLNEPGASTTNNNTINAIPNSQDISNVVPTQHTNIANTDSNMLLNGLETSISYLLPYIWYMRYQFFVSFMFVLVVWILLQIVLYFVNLAFRSGALTWASLLSTELLDFVVFAGVIYTFTMSCHPFIISGRHVSNNEQAYIPLETIAQHTNTMTDQESNNVI